MENFLLALQIAALLAAGFYLLEIQRKYNQKQNEKTKPLPKHRLARIRKEYLNSINNLKPEKEDLEIPRNFNINKIN